MLPRQVIPLPEDVYPRDPWRLVETRFDAEHLDRAETVFSQANGFVGFRGTFDEGRPSHLPGTFVNGFHETWPIEHAEEAYGLARTGQTIVNVPDATVIELYVDDEPLYLPFARMPEYERVLDMRTGVLTRFLHWSTPSGKHVEVRSRRLVSFEHRHLVAIEYELVVLDKAAPVALVSKVVNRQDVAHAPHREAGEEGVVDPRRPRAFDERVLVAGLRERSDGRFLQGYRTARSGMRLGMGVDHVIETTTPHEVDHHQEEDVTRLVVTADAQPGVPIRLTKYVAYQSSRSVPEGELVARCERTLDRTVSGGMDALVAAQRTHLKRFWDRADIEVEAGDITPQLQQAVRWNLFQLAQAALRAEGTGIPAKGLTGQAYEGHYFWDTEIYVLPFLTYNYPRIARNQLRFRHSMLDHARARARELSNEGALFPWRTINGEEASAYYQAGTAQYHIDADIIYALRRYVDVRGDADFHLEVGADLLVETARMYADLGFHDAQGHFHIHAVTGPDEYTTVVDDNAYTNLMARFNLRYAAEVIRGLEEERPDEHRALVRRLALRDGEVDAWERAAEHMHIPYDEQRGIHPQDSRFLEREPWDLAATPAEHFPLLLHYHPLVIYRYQVIKQADVVLALFLLGNEFSREQKQRDFAYYDPLTTGDSSLSASVQSIVAAECGNEAKALEYFDYALMMDLADLAGNVADGVHIASAGGVWQALVFGFGGVQDSRGRLRIDSHLPQSWERLSFSLRFQDRQVRITHTHEQETYRLDEGEPLEVTVGDQRHELRPDSPLVLERGNVGGA
jgi:alpha,alpha-trehalose phosphorylase